MDEWLFNNFPNVCRWQYDDNCGERSIDLFHVHIFIETIPFCFEPNFGKEYYPPHLLKIAPPNYDHGKIITNN